MDSTRLLLREQPYSRATQHDHGSSQYTNLLRHKYVRYHYGDGALHHHPRTQILLKFIRPSRALFQTLLWDMMDINWHKGLRLHPSQYQLSTTPPTALHQLRYLLTQTQPRQGRLPIQLTSLPSRQQKVLRSMLLTQPRPSLRFLNVLATSRRSAA